MEKRKNKKKVGKIKNSFDDRNQPFPIKETLKRPFPKAKKHLIDVQTMKFAVVDLYIPEMDMMEEVAENLERAKKRVSIAKSRTEKKQANIEFQEAQKKYLEIRLPIIKAWYKIYLDPILKLAPKESLEILQQLFPVYQAPPGAPNPTYKTYEEDVSQWVRHPYFKKGDDDIDDKEFLKLIRANPVFLGFPFAQKKIRRWQMEMRDQDKEKALSARDKLTDIGTHLAFKNYDKKRTHATVVAQKRDEILEKIRSARISQIRHDIPRKIRLKELFGQNLIDQLSDSIPGSAVKLANVITAKRFNLASGDVIKKYCLEVVKVAYGGKTPAYILKTPK